MTPKVLLSVPVYTGVDFRTFDAIRDASAAGRVFGVQYVKSSLLTKCFNQLWCAALNNRAAQGLTHFAMLHADVFPESGWLDRMLAIAEDVGADVLSAVMPMKSGHGLTSTAVEAEDVMRPKRFTVKQVHTMPETFTHPGLLLNTGLMLVDIRQPWVEKIHFRFVDEIRRVDGRFEALSASEDWNFSRDARALGAELFATRAVKAHHQGDSLYPNFGEWGSWATDEAHGTATL